LAAWQLTGRLSNARNISARAADRWWRSGKCTSHQQLSARRAG